MARWVWVLVWAVCVVAGCARNRVTGDSWPSMQVVPDRLTFPDAAPGDTVRATVRIDNSGEGLLSLRDFELEVASTDHAELRWGPRAEMGSTGAELPEVLTVEGLASIYLFVEAQFAGPPAGEVRFRSNDGEQPFVTLTIDSMGRASHIVVTPEAIDFGRVPPYDALGDEAPPSVDLTITNQGDAPLILHEIRMTGAGFRAAIGGDDTSQQPERLDDPDGDGAAGLSPGAAVVLSVSLEAPDAQSRAGEVRILSNDPDRPEVVIPLHANGRPNQCPVAVSTRETLSGRPTGILTLDGSPSHDPDGEVVAWEWVVVERPEGSTAQVVENFEDPAHPASGGLPDDPDTPTAFFFIDANGPFTFELRVTDDEGCGATATVPLL